MHYSTKNEIRNEKFLKSHPYGIKILSNNKTKKIAKQISPFGIRFAECAPKGPSRLTVTSMTQTHDRYGGIDGDAGDTDN